MDLWKCYKTIVYEIFVHLQQMWKITKFALDNFLLKILQYSAWFEYL